MQGSAGVPLHYSAAAAGSPSRAGGACCMWRCLLCLCCALGLAWVPWRAGMVTGSAGAFRTTPLSPMQAAVSTAKPLVSWHGCTGRHLLLVLLVVCYQQQLVLAVPLGRAGMCHACAVPFVVCARRATLP